ncbi:hypothetical protein N7470_007538 [Penicillium chermesinum]|nr:hypothetical protein N7470_007538 [Penicillium chermesinum]
MTVSQDSLAAVLPRNAPPWYRQKRLLRLNLIIISLVMYSSANGYDGSLMNGLQALDQWKSFMDNPEGARLGWINAIYLLGCGVGYICASWIAGRYGRKPGVYFGFCFLTLGVVLQTVAQNSTTFLMARLFLKGNRCAIRQRRFFNALFMSGWYIGERLRRGWFSLRGHTDLLGPGGYLLFFILAGSFRLGGKEDARDILVHFHADGDESSLLVNYELREMKYAIWAESRDKESNTGSYAEMLRTRGNRWRLMISISLGFFAQWVGNSVISYYLALILDSVGVTNVRDQTLISACLQMRDLIFAGLGAFLTERVGRRPLFMSSAVIMFISYVLVTGLSGSFASNSDATTGAAVIPFLFIFFAGYGIALTPFLTSYPCEIWPFHLRSRGLTVTWVATLTAMFFNTFVNPIALAAIGWKYYFVFLGVLITFGITAYFFYPETRGYTLEQIAVIFDGSDVRDSDGLGSSQVHVETAASEKTNADKNLTETVVSGS